MITKLLGDNWLTRTRYTSRSMSTHQRRATSPFRGAIALRRGPSFANQIALLDHDNHAWLPQRELAANKISVIVAPMDTDDPQEGGDSIHHGSARSHFRGD